MRYRYRKQHITREDFERQVVDMLNDRMMCNYLNIDYNNIGKRDVRIVRKYLITYHYKIIRDKDIDVRGLGDGTVGQS